MIKPNRLQTGDTVMFIAPASPPRVEDVEKMKTKMEDMGLHVVIGKSVYDQYGYLAGEDIVRLTDLHIAFSNPTIKGIFCACGGYGSGRILDSIDFEIIKNNPKIFWGYSDITALHAVIQKEAGLVTFHAPMMQELGKDDVHEDSFASLEQVFDPKELEFTANETGVYPSFAEEVTAPMIGGNLTVMTSLIGTGYEMDAEGKILFIEEINEDLYRIDRMFLQLRLAGVFDNIKGLVLGDFLDCGPGKRKETLTLSQIVHDHVADYGVPILSGFEIGHCTPHYGIPFGTEVKMNGKTKTITFSPGVK